MIVGRPMIGENALSTHYPLTRATRVLDRFVHVLGTIDRPMHKHDVLTRRTAILTTTHRIGQ
jgi:hypothetical protein